MNESHMQHSQHQQALASGKMAKDPICGMMVDKTTALSRERGGHSYYFLQRYLLAHFRVART